jgi:hypothetical protein
VVKLKVTIQSPEMVPDDTSDEAEEPSLVPLVAKVDMKGKGKALLTEILPSQIEGGYSVYDPKIPNQKIGSIKARPRQPGEHNSISPISFHWFGSWLNVLQ